MILFYTILPLIYNYSNLSASKKYIINNYHLGRIFRGRARLIGTALLLLHNATNKAVKYIRRKVLPKRLLWLPK